MKMKSHEPKVKPQDDDSPVSQPDTASVPVSSGITCSYGIHRGKFPIAGMKVRDARAVLKKLIKVDDKAAAVINGQVVGEDETISAETTMLSFVKPSAVKGTDTITITDRVVKMDNKKVAIDQFCSMLSNNTISGIPEEPIPDNVKWIVRAGKLEVYIAEFKPELRRIKWIAADSPEPYGSGAKYQDRRLATPYVVMKACFINGQLQNCVELFYRNMPLEKVTDKLSHCNLLNVSINAHNCHAWFCTQYLNVSGIKGTSNVLTEVLNHVWGGGFNESSEGHEGVSGFSLGCGKTSKRDTKMNGKKLDSRVTDVQLWESESIKDPRFVLDIDWHDAGTTPKDLIEGELRRFGIQPAPTTATCLGNIMLASKLLV